MDQNSPETNQPASENSALDDLRRNTPSVITDNAPRVVAGAKIAGAATMMLMPQNWPFRIAGAFFIAGNVILGMFGHKKTDEEVTKLQAEEDAKSKSDNPLLSHIGKVLQPKKYPYESGLTVFAGGSLFWLGAGVWEKFKMKRGWGTLIAGACSLAADVNGAFNKEKADSKDTDPVTYLKNRPIMVTSALNIIGSDIGSIVAGANKFAKNNKHPHEMIVGGLFLFANTFQALFVNKNDYSIEKKKTDEPALPALPAAPTTQVASADHQAMLQLVSKEATR